MRGNELKNWDYGSWSVFYSIKTEKNRKEWSIKSIEVGYDGDAIIIMNKRRFVADVEDELFLQWINKQNNKYLNHHFRQWFSFDLCTILHHSTHNHSLLVHLLISLLSHSIWFLWTLRPQTQRFVYLIPPYYPLPIKNETKWYTNIILTQLVILLLW